MNQIVSGLYLADDLKNLYTHSPTYKASNGYVLPTFEENNKLKLEYDKVDGVELVQVDGTTIDEVYKNGIQVSSS